MPKPELQDFARNAAAAGAPANTVGAFVELIEEGENLFTYLFETKQKGYVGWRWSVTVFEDSEGPTVSEVLLMPGPDSLLAPNWIPWSERLADWKALQAELERQAAEDAALAAEEDEAGDDSEEGDDADSDAEAEGDDFETGDDADDAIDSAEASAQGEEGPDSELEEDGESSEDSAATDLEPSENAEADSGKARSRVPRFIRRRGRRSKNKDND